MANLSADERNCLLRITVDAMDVAILNILTTHLGVPRDETTRHDLLERQGGAWTHITSHGGLLIRLVHTIDTAGFVRIMADSETSPRDLFDFLEVADREGGIHQMLEQRINDVLATPWPHVRIRLQWHRLGTHPTSDGPDADINATFDIDPKAMICAAGALAVAGGAGLAVSGGGMLADLALRVGIMVVARTG